jgi:hypothetical protein
LTGGSEVPRLQKRLARAEHACGCPEGAVAALGAISIYCVLVLFPSAKSGVGSVVARSLGGVAIMVLAAVAGKLMGRALAARRARRLRGRLAALQIVPIQAP